MIGFLILSEEPRLHTNTIMGVLKQILKSKINREKVKAIKDIHRLLVKRDESFSSQVKKLISEANAKRSESGGSCTYDDTLDDDELNGAGGSGATGSGQETAEITGSQTQEKTKEETTKDNKKDAEAKDEGETDILDILEGSILRFVVDCFNAEKDVVNKEAVKNVEVTVKEDTVMKDTVKGLNKETVTGKIVKTSKSKRTKQKAKA